MKASLAVQLYTLRHELDLDFPGVLQQLKSMGWAGIELAGYHGHSAEQVAAWLRETDLQAAGMHVGYERLVGELQSVTEEALIFGLKHLVCPGTPMELRSPDGYRQVKQKLQEVAGILESKGIVLSYHNHAFEFDVYVEGRPALEYLLDDSNASGLKAETDVYWIRKAGYDPAEYLNRYTGRAPLLHLKDMAVDGTEDYAEIGTGLISFDPILEWGMENGVEWFIVEQDECKGPAMDSLGISYANLVNRITKILENQ
ncbi:sugar phosphate isomerase/epimerase family protein [Paenibacillus lautus]|uniref:sugar phosphate isomerase/epimerase family protein n=1 Tax=Paenibacillus lautus TaxID=1401 RepID=UPI001C129097|nr:TIM barrel protein [Paenibacillus lautus]MBU5348429.1 sugar phosphate isomerase/epimerase [Paenibacillus lautus]